MPSAWAALVMAATWAAASERRVLLVARPIAMTPTDDPVVFLVIVATAAVAAITLIAS